MFFFLFKTSVSVELAAIVEAIAAWTEIFLPIFSLVGPLIPGPPFQKPSRLFFVGTTPLLEEEGNARRQALVSDLCRPGGVHEPGSGAGLAAHDHPVDSA